MNFDPLAVFGLLEMMHGSNYDFVAYRKKKPKKKKLYCKIILIDFCTVATQWSRISGHFLIIHDKLLPKFDLIVIFGLLERINGLDFVKGLIKFQKLGSNSLDFFAIISKT